MMPTDETLIYRCFVLPYSSTTKTADDEPPRTLAMDKERNHWAACYHEAGHAVFAYEVGWWVNYEGVEVGNREYTGIGCLEIDYTPWRRACVFMAGLMAEYKFLHLKSFPRDAELSNILTAVRAGHQQEGDEAEILRALVDQFPDAPDGDLIDLYREYQQVLLYEMEKSDSLWNRIQKIAQALFQKPRLTADEVEALLEQQEVA
jgi:hypothetical protein